MFGLAGFWIFWKQSWQVLLMGKKGLIKNEFRIFLVVQGLELWAILKKELWASTAGDMGSIPGWEKKILQAIWCSHKKIWVQRLFYLFAALQANKGWREGKDLEFIMGHIQALQALWWEERGIHKFRYKQIWKFNLHICFPWLGNFLWSQATLYLSFYPWFPAQNNNLFVERRNQP